MLANALGPASVTRESQRTLCGVPFGSKGSPATFTMKWEAAAKPITLLRSAMGRTSAPYNQVVLFSIPSVNYKVSLTSSHMRIMQRYTHSKTQQIDKCRGWQTLSRFDSPCAGILSAWQRRRFQLGQLRLNRRESSWGCCQLKYNGRMLNRVLAATPLVC